MGIIDIIISPLVVIALVIVQIIKYFYFIYWIAVGLFLVIVAGRYILRLRKNSKYKEV